jgi:hypothetical protein
MMPTIPPAPIAVPVEIISAVGIAEVKSVDFPEYNPANQSECCAAVPLEIANPNHQHYSWQNLPPAKKTGSVTNFNPQILSSTENYFVLKPSETEAIAIPVEALPTNKAGELGHPISISEERLNLPDSTPPANTPQTVKVTRLLTKSRQGEQHEFEFLAQGANQNPVTIPIEETVNVVEVVADEQEYLDGEQIIKARGNVIIRFSRGVLSADRVKINLPDRIAVAEGNVVLKRGDQILRGNRFEYYFVQDRGVIFNANGEIYQPGMSRDFEASTTANNPVPQQPLSWQLEANQPLRRVVSAEGYRFAVGSIRDLNLLGDSGGIGSTSSGGQINRFRFQAERVDFDSDGWHATDIRITNDPFSPPEFEIRADTADLTNLEPFVDELTTTNSRLVFDQTVSVPLFQDRLVFDRRERRPGLFNIGFDGEDRGGLYIERDFEIYSDERIEFTLTPQSLLQRAILPDSFEDQNAIDPDDNGGIFNPSSFGLIADLEVNFSPRTDLVAIANFTGLDLDNINNRLRATLQLNHKIGQLDTPYTFSFQYNFRERLFNGSLGFQTVQESVGGLIRSPYIPFGNSGIGITYQGSVQNITADTDRQDLLETNQTDRLANLTRYQAAALISGGFLLWSEAALPPTAEEGLKYTATPVAPFLRLNTGLTGVTSYYSNGDTQPSLTGSIGFDGQFGHFSNPFLDYTGFNITYSQGLRGDESPFFFDRFTDTQVLSLGLTQQLYGPVRVGVQTFLNVDTNQEISTDYFLEYSRRTYNIILRYNPVLQIGSINLRISDFNWEGNPAPFEGTGIKPVIDGVTY